MTQGKNSCSTFSHINSAAMHATPGTCTRGVSTSKEYPNLGLLAEPQSYAWCFPLTSRSWAMCYSWKNALRVEGGKWECCYWLVLSSGYLNLRGKKNPTHSKVIYSSENILKSRRRNSNHAKNVQWKTCLGEEERSELHIFRLEKVFILQAILREVFENC